MNAGRAALYFIGVLLVVAALLMFFFQAGLNRWVPVGMLAAGVILIIGLAVMSFADTAPPERTVERRYGEGRADEEKDVTVINNR